MRASVLLIQPEYPLRKTNQKSEVEPNNRSQAQGRKPSSNINENFFKSEDHANA